MQWWNKKPSLNFPNNKTLNLPQTKRSDWISKETQLNSLAPKTQKSPPDLKTKAHPDEKIDRL